MATKQAERVGLLRAVVTAAVAYVGDDSGECDASGLDASERLSEALVALGDGAPERDARAWAELAPTERAIVRAAWRGVCGTLADDPIGTDRAGLDRAVAKHLETKNSRAGRQTRRARRV
jgi:hypothetical protein